jgi:hypothetical protein
LSRHVTQRIVRQHQPFCSRITEGAKIVETDHRIETDSKTGVTAMSNQTQMATAISQALEVPFDVWGADDITLPLVDADGDEDEWAVFANHHPRKSGLAIARSLCKKLRASYEVDEPDYFDQQLVTTFDITAQSGKWPDSIVDPGPGYANAAAVRHRLVLFCNDEPIGFCTVQVEFRHCGGTTEVEIGLDVRAVFVEPKHRERGLSHLLAEGVGALTVDLAEQLASRLQRHWTGESCPVVIVFEGEAISEGDQ